VMPCNPHRPTLSSIFRLELELKIG
jgi:hypothetical protein